MKQLTKSEMGQDIIELKELVGKEKSYKILKKYNDCTYTSNNLLTRCLMYKTRQTIADIRGEFMMASAN